MTRAETGGRYAPGGRAASAGLVQQNRRLFEAVVRASRGQLRRHRWQSAVGWAQTAAAFAAQCHPGWLTSRELEIVLEECGQVLVKEPRSEERSDSSDPSRVLHVMSSVATTGGHTRWVNSWIRADTQRKHSIVLVDQRAAVPSWLRQATAMTGGEVMTLPCATAPWERADMLRTAARDADLVVLATHQADVIGPLAFGSNAAGVKRLRLNHADHMFWLGTSISDVVLDFREVGQYHSIAHRGFDRARCFLSPLPVVAPDPIPRSAARQSLGLPHDAPVLLSAGGPYKFESSGGLGFLDVIEPLLAALPELIVLVAGPSPVGRWATVAKRWQGRLRPLGVRPGIADCFRAADIYLDSYPVGSDTALVEAALARCVVARYQPEGTIPLIQGDHDCFEGSLLTPENPEELIDDMSAVLGDAEARHRLQVEAYDRAYAAHGPASWAVRLPHIYAAVAGVTHADATTLAPASATSETTAEALACLEPYRPVRRLAFVALSQRRSVEPTSPIGVVLARLMALGRRRPGYVDSPNRTPRQR